jgi:AGZA family xanthine/uracil permease-like MFS transporter
MMIGLVNAGVVKTSERTLVALGAFTPEMLVSFAGLLLTIFLMTRKVKASLLVGILFTSFMAWGFGIFQHPSSVSNIVSLPDFSILSLTLGKLDLIGALKLAFLPAFLTFLFVDIFDTVGVMIGLASEIGILDEKGDFKNSDRCLLSDAMATMAGAVLGTSTVTTYVESAAGVAEGGKTGFPVLIVGLLFLVSLFFIPLIEFIPLYAATPALLIVGIIMAKPIRDINFDNLTEALPALFTILIMPLTFSIANGLMFGIILYTLINTLFGRRREVSATMWILTVLFLIMFILST